MADTTPTAAHTLSPAELDKLEALARAPMQAATAMKAAQALTDLHDVADPAAVLALIAQARAALTGQATAPAQAAPSEQEDPRITAFYKLRDIAERDEDVESANIIQAAIADRIALKNACAAQGASGAPTEPFPERDPSKPAEQQGLFRKFDVRRVDGSDQPGGKHYGCRYYVLDLNHDQHAPAAMRAYAAACRATHPQLASDIEAEFGASTASTVPMLTMKEAFESVGGWYSGGELGYPSFGSANALWAYTDKMQRNAVARATSFGTSSASAQPTIPRVPTEAMLNAARDWSVKVIGQGVGNKAATGCWQAMFDAAPSGASGAQGELNGATGATGGEERKEVHLLHSEEQDILLMANYHATDEDDGNYGFQSGGLLALIRRVLAQYGHLAAARAAASQAAPGVGAELMATLRAVKEWDIDGWKERGFALPTELRARIQSLVTPGRKCWNCAEISEPCYDGGTPWCVECGVVDNPTRPAAIEHDHSEGGHHD